MVYGLRYFCKRQYQKFIENYNKALILFWGNVTSIEQFRKLLDVYEIPKQCNGMVDISIQHLIFPVTCAERK